MNSPIDLVAKVFKVEQGMRRCMVCEKLFNREASRRHALTPCRPQENKMKILIVDDDDVLRTRLAKHLRTLWG